MKHADAVASTGVVATRASSAPADYFALTKPRLNFLVVASSAAGYFLGAPQAIDGWRMAEAVAGTALVAAGAAVLNQVAERDTDALMRRTRTRPVPDGRVSPKEARLFGRVLSFAGLAVLAARTTPLAVVLAAATLVIYLTIYTPMKRLTPAATFVGAIPGALPPLIGWAAAHGSIAAGGAVLFAIVFLWQIPHFMAIAWMYRDDYAAAGFPMLPVIDPDGRRVGWQAVLYAATLLPVSLLPMSRPVYFLIAFVLGAALLALAINFSRVRTDRSARVLFYGSITYLPLLWIAMIANKVY